MGLHKGDISLDEVGSWYLIIIITFPYISFEFHVLQLLVPLEAEKDASKPILLCVWNLRSQDKWGTMVETGELNKMSGRTQWKGGGKSIGPDAINKIQRDEREGR